MIFFLKKMPIVAYRVLCANAGYTIYAKGSTFCGKATDFSLRQYSQLHGLQKH